MPDWLGRFTKWIWTGVVLILGYVLDRALGGVIGNRIDAALLFVSEKVGPHVGWRETGELLAVILIPIVGGLAWWGRGRIETGRLRELREARGELQEVRELVKKIGLVVRLDEGLIRSIPSLLPRSDREDVLRVLVREWLKDCAAIFAPDVSRAILLRPVDENWLEPWESYGMPESSLAGRRFYIGKAHDPARSRGIAGEVYVSGEPQVVSMQKDGDVWRADCTGYIDFEQEIRFPRYMTFVAIPVDGENQRRIGVLCLDSKTPGTFDHEPLVELLLALGERIGLALTLTGVLQELDPE